MIIELILYILIGLLYNYLIYLGTETAYSNLDYTNKENKKFVTLIIFAILAISLSYIVNDKRHKYYNKTVSKGIYFGGILMVLISITSHWYDMSKTIKTFIIAILFYILIKYSYSKNKVKKKKKKYIIKY
tara:strand:+ start:142 stop:531 length:390 start_codon:yes stop_codon:yes gene_type:complete